MDEFNKLKTLKTTFSKLISDLYFIKDNCIKNNKEIVNLDDRLDTISNCINKSSQDVVHKINLFKSDNSIEVEDNNVVLSHLEKKNNILELDKVKEDYPLSNDEYWKHWFDVEYRRSENYLHSYFKANDYLIYKQNINIRNLCMNHQTFNGDGYKANDIVNCIKRAKEIYK